MIPLNLFHLPSSYVYLLDLTEQALPFQAMENLNCRVNRILYPELSMPSSLEFQLHNHAVHRSPKGQSPASCNSVSD